MHVFEKQLLNKLYVTRNGRSGGWVWWKVAKKCNLIFEWPLTNYYLLNDLSAFYGQFYFCERRSQNGKNTVKLFVLFCTFKISVQVKAAQKTMGISTTKSNLINSLRAAFTPAEAQKDIEDFNKFLRFWDLCS